MPLPLGAILSASMTETAWWVMERPTPVVRKFSNVHGERFLSIGSYHCTSLESARSYACGALGVAERLIRGWPERAKVLADWCM